MQKSTISFTATTIDGKTITMSMSADSSWPDIVEDLLDFLRAAGYIIPYGTTVIVESEEEA